jgi:hypothetical protein
MEEGRRRRTEVEEQKPHDEVPEKDLAEIVRNPELIRKHLEQMITAVGKQMPEGLASEEGLDGIPAGQDPSFYMGGFAALNCLMNLHDSLGLTKERLMAVAARLCCDMARAYHRAVGKAAVPAVPAASATGERKKRVA